VGFEPIGLPFAHPIKRLARRITPKFLQNSFIFTLDTPMKLATDTG